MFMCLNYYDRAKVHPHFTARTLLSASFWTYGRDGRLTNEAECHAQKIILEAEAQKKATIATVSPIDALQTTAPFLIKGLSRE